MYVHLHALMNTLVKNFIIAIFEGYLAYLIKLVALKFTMIIIKVLNIHYFIYEIIFAYASL